MEMLFFPTSELKHRKHMTIIAFVKEVKKKNPLSSSNQIIPRLISNNLDG